MPSSSHKILIKRMLQDEEKYDLAMSKAISIFFNLVSDQQ